MTQRAVDEGSGLSGDVGNERVIPADESVETAKRTCFPDRLEPLAGRHEDRLVVGGVVISQASDVPQLFVFADIPGMHLSHLPRQLAPMASPRVCELPNADVLDEQPILGVTVVT